LIPCSSTRLESDTSAFSIEPRYGLLGLTSTTSPPHAQPGTKRAPVPVPRRPGHRPAGSAVVSSRVHVHGGRLPSHPGWHRSPAVPDLPDCAHSPPSCTGPRDHGVHRGALGHPDCLSVRPGTGRQLVSAARGDAHTPRRSSIWRSRTS
jgi:hypothetical protein